MGRRSGWRGAGLLLVLAASWGGGGCGRFGLGILEKRPAANGDGDADSDVDGTDADLRDAPDAGAGPDSDGEGSAGDEDSDFGGGADGAAADADAEAPRDAGARELTVLVGIQGLTRSFIVELGYDPGAGVATRRAVHDLTSVGVTGSGLRAFAACPDGLLLGSVDDGNVVWTLDSALRPIRTTHLVGGPFGELPDVMALCELPDGHLVASSYVLGLAAEYDGAGSYVREVYDTVHHMPGCVRTGEGGLVVIDYDADSDLRTTLRRLALAGGLWGETGSFELTTVGGSTGSSAWTLALHTSGDLYVPPLHPGGGGTSRMVRCEAADLARCAEVGDDAPLPYPEGAVEGCAQIPGEDDLLVADHRSLYRFEVAVGTWTELATLDPPEVDWVRNLIIEE